MPALDTRRAQRRSESVLAMPRCQRDASASYATIPGLDPFDSSRADPLCRCVGPFLDNRQDLERLVTRQQLRSLVVDTIDSSEAVRLWVAALVSVTATDDYAEGIAHTIALAPYPDTKEQHVPTS